MQSDDEPATQPRENGDAKSPLLPAPSTRHRWVIGAALLIAAALSIWRCG